MTRPTDQPRFGFFITPPHACGYLPDRDATTIFLDPRVRPTPATYALLSEHGFRRSGEHVYRPHCTNCASCIAVRVRVDAFKPKRFHRRALMRNAQVQMRAVPAAFNAEHFHLYCRYISARHPGGSMENPDRNAYLEFLTASWANTVFYEFRCAAELLAVAVVDRLVDGLSAVYTFFDPAATKLSLGRYAILKQIELTRQERLAWLYLGYWIEDCHKMSYKSEYEPLQYFVAGEWRAQPPQRETNT